MTVKEFIEKIKTELGKYDQEQVSVDLIDINKRLIKLEATNKIHSSLIEIILRGEGADWLKSAKEALKNKGDA